MLSFKQILALLLLLSPVWILEAAQEEQSLNGEWEIVFDDQNEGRSKEWFIDDTFGALDNRQSITVPVAWETIKKDYEGVAFYRKSFDVPADWKGKVVRLHFDAVNYIAEVWVNDEVVGYHEGGFTPFDLRVDSMLKPGEENVVTLRVQGPIILSEKEVDGIGPLQTPQWRGGITGGIWQSVKLVATDAVYLDDVYIRPDWKTGAVSFDVEFNNTAVLSEDVAVKIEVRQAGAVISGTTFVSKDFSLRPGVSKRNWVVEVPTPNIWSPDSPNLYTAKVSVLSNGQSSDVWQHRFGFREFSIKDEDFYLNGERLYLKATFFEGLYPNGVAYPDSEKMVRKEIQLAKEAGFNMIRPWRRPPAPMWLDIADEMGVLVVGAPVLECMRLPLSTPYLPSMVENEIREAVLRDRNRTCVVKWELFNELHRPVLMQMMRPMALMVRELDPTRMILDESGGWAYGANMYLPGEYEPTKFNDIHNYAGPLINDYLYNGYLTIGMTRKEKLEFGFSGRSPGRNVVPGLMSFISELGYGSLPNMPLNNDLFSEKGNPILPAYRYHERIQKEQIQTLEEAGFSHLYPDFTDFCEMQQSIHGAANKRMIEAVRSNPKVDGYCIHALAAGNWIFGAGLIDLWRNPKGEAYTATAAANQPRIVSIRMFPRNVYAEEGTRLTVTGINDKDPVSAELSVRILSENGKVVFEESSKTSWQSGISDLFETKLNTNDFSGSYTVEATMFDSTGSLLTRNSFTFDVFEEDSLEYNGERIAVIDSDGTLRAYLEQKGIAYDLFGESTPKSVPVFVADLEASNSDGQFDTLNNHVKAGGTAIYMGSVTTMVRSGGPAVSQLDTLPFEGELIQSKGLWTCIPHLVKDHPIFEGLPVDGPMRETYENVWATATLAGLGGETVAASIGYEWFSRDHKMHYSGPGDSWWGADLAIVPYGKGKCIVSMLRLVENLGSDPVADKLLLNLIKFTSE